MAERLSTDWRAATWSEVAVDDTVLALWPGRAEPVEASVVAIESEEPRRPGWRLPRVRLEFDGWNELWRPYEPQDVVFVKSQIY